MKKIDLNIKIDDLEPKDHFAKMKGFEVAKQHIELGLTLNLRGSGNRGNSQGSPLSEHRRCYYVMDNLTDMVKRGDGILHVEEDGYNLLKNIFSDKGVNFDGGTKILIRVADKINNPLREDKCVQEEEVKPKE